MPIKHNFVSPKSNGADPTQVQPSHWNDDHNFTNFPYLFALDYDFPAISISSNLTGGITNTITLPYGILGISGQNKFHYLRIVDAIAGNEIVLINGGTATSGVVGTLSFQCSLSHTAGNWTLMSATSGIQEALYTLTVEAGPPMKSGGSIIVGKGRHPIYATITFPYSGIILSGESTSQGHYTQHISTVLEVASTFVGSITANGPVIDIDSKKVNEVQSTVWPFIRGIALENITVDVCDKPTATPILRLRSLSNVPNWRNVTVYGTLRTALDLDTSDDTAVSPLPCEGIVFENFYVYAMFNRDGTASASDATLPAVRVAGSNEITFRDGKVLAGHTIGPDANPLLDVPAIEVLSTDSTYANTQSQGILFDEMSTTTYAVHYRVRGSIFTPSGIYFAPNYVRWANCTIENFNRAIVIRDETPPVGPPIWVSLGYYVAKSNRFITTFGATPRVLTCDYLRASTIEWAEGVVSASDYMIVMGSHTNANYIIGGSTLAGGVYSQQQILDNGSNIVILAGEFQPYYTIQGSLTVVGKGGAPNPAIGSSVRGLYAYGDTQQLWSMARTPTTSSDDGVFGEICFDTNYLYICIATNTWKRIALASF